MNKIRYIIFILLLLIAIIFVYFLVIKSAIPKNSSMESYQKEIIGNSEKHKNDFKSLSEDPNEAVVIITTYSREIFDRTEYAIGIQYSDFKNPNNKSGLKNESEQLTLDSRNFIQKVISDLKNNKTAELIKLVDQKIIKIVGEDNLIKKYSQYSQYFSDYKSHDINDGFAINLVDDSVVLLENFVSNTGDNKMFGMIFSKTNSGYFLNEVFPGETSVIIAFPPEQNKSPIIVANPIKDFTRRDMSEIGGSALMPNGWYFRHELKKGTEAYFFSREEIVGDNGMFETGLSLNAIQKQNVPGGDVEKYINTFIDGFKKRGKIDSETSNQGDSFSYREIMGTFDDNGFLVKEVLRVVVNTKTNTLYIIVFEATPEKWSVEWSADGKTILEYLSLDPTY